MLCRTIYPITGSHLSDCAMVQAKTRGPIEPPYTPLTFPTRQVYARRRRFPCGMWPGWPPAGDAKGNAVREIPALRVWLWSCFHGLRCGAGSCKAAAAPATVTGELASRQPLAPSTGSREGGGGAFEPGARRPAVGDINLGSLRSVDAAGSLWPSGGRAAAGDPHSAGGAEEGPT